MHRDEQLQHDRCLVVVASLPSIAFGSQVRLTKKFLEGIDTTRRLWRGPVVVVMPADCNPSSGNLDDIYVEVRDLQFDVRVVDFKDTGTIQELVSVADVVQMGPDHRLRSLPAYCKTHGIKLVMVTEYTLRTRLQILHAEVSNILLRWRRSIWAMNQELHTRRAIRAADAVQCNGTPTFDTYSRINANTLLFFDSRITHDLIIKNASLMRRVSEIQDGSPIRLAFSGRLNRMKGADDLLRVASHLSIAKVPFHLDIFGDGPLLHEMKQNIIRSGLGKLVTLRGVWDFTSQLVPYLRKNVDLFVCCHRQGDPSCTYLETLACGVPIVGYANEALLGIVNRENVGWTTPLNKPVDLAKRIQELRTEPKKLEVAALLAVEFARKHTFELEFQARTRQMMKLLQAQSDRSATNRTPT